MSILSEQEHFIAAQVLDLVLRERQVALSRREWKHRLAGYGYGVRESESGDVVETLRDGAQVCVLPN